MPPITLFRYIAGRMLVSIGGLFGALSGSSFSPISSRICASPAKRAAISGLRCS